MDAPKEMNERSCDPMDYPTDLYEIRDWLVDHGINVEIREHTAYTELRDVRPVIARVAGTDHLFAFSPRGKISIIRGFGVLGPPGCYEIYCLEGNLFDDTEQYPDTKSCGEKICELLKPIQENK